MGFSIRSNSAATAASTNLSSTQELLGKSMNQLSSGDRIINAGEDAAGLGISRNLQAQISSYTQASRNAKDGMSLTQTANGYLAGVQDQLARLRQLAIQAASDGLGSDPARLRRDRGDEDHRRARPACRPRPSTTTPRSS